MGLSSLRPVCRRVASVLLVLVSASIVACSGSGPEERYALTGRVVSVDRDAMQVTLEHDEIPGYMAAMTMPFRVKEQWAMAALEPGSRVDAELVVVGGRSWIENVVVSSSRGVPSVPSAVEGPREPLVDSTAPPVALIDQEGNPISLEQFRGKAVALTFIFTRCPIPDYCPLMSENFAKTTARALDDPAVSDRVRFLSISIDPEFDTPPVLKAYAARYLPESARARPPIWHFATGDPQAVRAVAESYGLVYQEENGQIVHSLRTAIIAPDGKLRKLYRGNEWTSEDLYQDLISVLKTTE